ncbi:branched-chain amino acid ABC transporter permease [Planctomycetota bacterium]
MDQLTQILFDAVTLGAIYALIAVGYTMVYGIILLINFAHGEIFMIGTYVGLLCVADGGLPLAIAMLAAMGACAMLGAVLDFSAYLPLRRTHGLPDKLSIVGLAGFSLLAIAYFQVVRADPTATAVMVLGVLLVAIPALLFVVALVALLGFLGRPSATVRSDRLCALITAIGMSLSLQTIAQLVWTAEYKSFPDPMLPPFLQEAVVTVAGTQLLGKEVAIWGATLVLMVGLGYLVSYTRLGKAMRACAQDKDMASLMGVNVNYVIAMTFMVGSAMAAVAGILYAIKVGGNISPRMGYYPGVIAFAAAVLGGIGSIRGAVAGGFIIGLTQSLGAKVAGAYDFAFAFGLMIVVILIRPWGLFGKAGAERA